MPTVGLEKVEGARYVPAVSAHGKSRASQNRPRASLMPGKVNQFSLLGALALGCRALSHLIVHVTSCVTR